MALPLPGEEADTRGAETQGRVDEWTFHSPTACRPIAVCICIPYSLTHSRPSPYPSPCQGEGSTSEASAGEGNDSGHVLRSIAPPDSQPGLLPSYPSLRVPGCGNEKRTYRR